MATLAPDPTLVVLSPLELATVAARSGLGPWSPVARRAVGSDDPAPITAEARAAALVGLVTRGLVVAAEAEGTVEVHPAVVAIAATLARASVLVEAVDEAGGTRRALALVPGTGGLLVDTGADGILLIALLDADVPVSAAVASLQEGGAPVTVRVITVDGAEVAGPAEGTGPWPAT